MKPKRTLWFLLTSLLLIAICLVAGLVAIVSLKEVGSSATGSPILNLSMTSAINPGDTTSTAQIAAPTQQFAVSLTAEPSQPPAAILETRRLTLEYPETIRMGDSDVIRMTLEVDSLGNITPTAEIQGNVVRGQSVQIPNLYDTHDVIAEARLDLAGPEIRPSAAIEEPLLPGQSITFFWSVRPTESGIYQGTAWLFLRFVDKTTRQESRKAISAQVIQIESTKFFGLSGSVARTTGGIGALVGAVLGFPFASDILKWLFARFFKKQ